MPDLRFSVDAIKVASSAAIPTLLFKLGIENSTPEERIHSILLRCQVQIQVARRSYTAEEKENLYELFDRTERWGKTLKSLAWTQVTLVVPGFEKDTVADLQVSCSFDFNVAGTKYFHALAGGEVPLSLLFTGTVFYLSDDGPLQVAQIPWDKEAECRFPVSIWGELMEVYYPNGVWLCLRIDVFDRINDFKVRNGLSSFDAALEKMAEAAEEGTTVGEGVKR